MSGFDISRVAFEPRKHYAGVRMQQGRVLTDDDWNENERIENEERRRSRTEVIGPFGSPDNGFKIKDLRVNGRNFDFDISRGVMHLGGLRLEMDADERFQMQRDWLNQRRNLARIPSQLPVGDERFDLVYMYAWQQPVSAVEDSALFETALGGPDTTTRLRNMRRVAILEDIEASDCFGAWQRAKHLWREVLHFGSINAQHEREVDARLRVTFNTSGVTDDLCNPSVAGGYLGAENQAIRVQIVDRTHLTWGFDNAAPLYRVQVSGNKVTMLTAPKDQYHWPLAGKVVEILPWNAVLSNGEKLAGRRGQLARVSGSYNPDNQEFTMVSALPAGFGEEWKQRNDVTSLEQGGGAYFYMRVWDRGSDVSSAEAVPFAVGVPVALGNTGLEVTITGTQLMSRDHWVIAARPDTPDKVSPWELLQTEGTPPHGVHHYFAPLAILRWSRNAAGDIEGQILHDCRKTFRPLTEQDCCCTYTVGDGRVSKGDYQDIQEAVDNLPADGGKVCVLPGIHLANVRIIGRRNIQIVGCGDRSIVIPDFDKDGLGRPIFYIEGSQRIGIEQLTMVHLKGVAIEVADKNNDNLPPSVRINIRQNRIIALVHAIKVRLDEDLGGDNFIYIGYNDIAMLDKEGGLPAIFALGDKMLIERNRIVVVPRRDPQNPDDPRHDDDGNNEPFDPCADPIWLYSTHPMLYSFINMIYVYHIAYQSFGRSRTNYLAYGGIQIGGSSERVRILENDIIGGRGNGITLGHLPSQETMQSSTYQFSYLAAMPNNEKNELLTTIYDTAIEGNRILEMGLSGIGPAAFLDLKTVGLNLRTEDFTAYRNSIMYCARQTPNLNIIDISDEARTNIAFGGIVLTDCENGFLNENRIENNGTSDIEPCCGIFLLHGEKIDISNNRIIGNGPRSTSDDIQRGNRGGIVVKMAFKQIMQDYLELVEQNFATFDGVPAIKVHDNIVTQPRGHALFLMAFGPVSVVSNQFTSQGSDRRNPFSVIASSVFIFNLGVSKDLLLLLLGEKWANMSENGANANSYSSSKPNLTLLKLLEYLPSGRTMFADNQTALDMRTPDSNLSFSSQLILSLDDIAFTSNQSECAAFLSLKPLAFDVALLNTVLLAPTCRVADNRFTDGLTLTLYSALSLGLLMATTTGNQATHCILTMGAKKAVANNLVLFDEACKDDAARRTIGKDRKVWEAI